MRKIKKKLAGGRCSPFFQIPSTINLLGKLGLINCYLPSHFRSQEHERE